MVFDFCEKTCNFYEINNRKSMKLALFNDHASVLLAFSRFIDEGSNMTFIHLTQQWHIWRKYQSLDNQRQLYISKIVNLSKSHTFDALQNFTFASLVRASGPSNSIESLFLNSTNFLLGLVFHRLANSASEVASCSKKTKIIDKNMNWKRKQYVVQLNSFFYVIERCWN